ncbi:hypothetical protein IEQ34_014686 [Dendrobium chrysotoxum]|uniref:Uncharacterized protein n=1 Tax=Dendrobium chrysotoxum TaxID=161865 RepID=A0AAV7G4I0_DENCH|nr:hypothetical protein IEQ34_014686 [Dendrobium chrysotoxum]
MGRLYRRLEATGCASLEEFSRGLSGEANGSARARAWKRKSEGSRRRFINVSKCRSSRSCAGFLGGDRFGADLKEFRPNIRRFEQDLRRDFNRLYQMWSIGGRAENGLGAAGLIDPSSAVALKLKILSKVEKTSRF